ncbi:hypothetical protein HNY73_009143 [Argiope bruennichi]|uniref:Uncharacterized protein n=1 Tax=Argiope bruennichi TaxID=94029 RepID=A0A8T0F9J1_ARGBR|nr:hypothetical protein HNY73_009143 [Argiope bruennichi]
MTHHDSTLQITLKLRHSDEKVSAVLNIDPEVLSPGSPTFIAPDAPLGTFQTGLKGINRFDRWLEMEFEPGKFVFMEVLSSGTSSWDQEIYSALSRKFRLKFFKEIVTFYIL